MGKTHPKIAAQALEKRTMRPFLYSRRQFVAGASVLSLALATRGHGQQSPGELIVHAPCGALRGERTAGCSIFRGIPFAQPPVGALRFKPPLALAPWAGVRDATRFASAAMQPGKRELAQSEDCLFLNIWTPGERGSYPVLVWIHGGGFTGGYSFSPDQDGAKLAAQGVVCVTVEYRLGLFGFLDMEPLRGAAYAGSANNALLDIMEALRWVQTNIAAFGGDPKRVTLGGQSAGAKLTDILMGVPAAEPLFGQMISESGGAERVWTRQQAQAVAVAFRESLAQTPEPQARDVLTAPAPLLIEAQERFTAAWPGDFPFRPEIHASVLPELPITRIRAGSTRGKRLLIGSNREESAFFLGPSPQSDPGVTRLGNMSPEQFAPVLAQYRQVYPEMPLPQQRIRAVTAEEYWIPSVRVVDAHVEAGGVAWMYRLDFTESSGRFAGEAYHSLDLPLVWDEPHEHVANAEAETALARPVHAAWIAFISGQAPLLPGLPAWPQYTTAERSTMVLDVQSRVEQKPQQAELALWREFLK